MVEAARGRGTVPALRIEGVTKRYRNNVAVDAVSLEVQKGELVSLLGPNGAGKSTLMDMIAGVIRPDQGDVWVMGHSLRRAPMAVRAALGVVPQDLALYPDLSARENLRFWGRMYGLSGARLARRTADLLEVVGLVERQRDRVETFSGGMKRRLNIAAALLHEPPVIMLDEPTVGIDPQSRRAILDYVKRLNDEGATVLYTTHYMEEAAELSDRIAILDRGRIIAQGTHEALTLIVGEHDRVELELSKAGIDGEAAFADLPGVLRVSAQDRRLELLANDGPTLLPGLFTRAAERGIAVRSVTLREPDLESVFLHLTGRALRD